MVFLKIEHFELIEQVLDSFGGLYNTKPVEFKAIIKVL